MKPAISLLLLWSIASLLSLNAQDSRPYRNFSTQKVHQQLLTNHPEFAQRLEQMESFIKNYGNAGDNRKDTIPVVFHILYTPGQAYPDENQIKAQLEALNRDFETYHPPVEPYVFDKIQDMANKSVDPGIFFCFPNYDAGGNATGSIQYVLTNVTEWQPDDAIKSVETGGSSPWEPGQYLNIWVGNLAEGKAGYAQFPGGPYTTDGIVIDTRYFASGTGEIANHYNAGKTLTHLVGNYLGLYDLWDETNPCADDKVSDTPIHNEPNYGLGTNYHHLSLCDTTLQIEMVINFMDNTDDEALTMFTQGQKNRMKAVLSAEGPRAHLPSGMVICGEDGLWSLEDRSKNSAPGQSPVMRLFPNPAVNILHLELLTPGSGKVKLFASSALGATIWQSEITSKPSAQLVSADCSAWPTGDYFVRAVFEDGKVLSQKVHIEKP